MSNIQYKIPGAILERGSDGKQIRKPFDATANVPFSEENLRQVEKKALPGTVQILADDEQLAPGANAQPDAPQRIRLQDVATGEIYALYIENGQLMKEVL